MSLLLDALKKAALEKQRREQPNSAKALVSAPPVATVPNENIPAAKEVVDSTSTSASAHDLGELNPHAFDELPVSAPESTSSKPLAANSDAVVEHQGEGLVFDINEIDQHYLLPPEHVDESVSIADEESIVDGFVRKASALAVPANSNPLSMVPMPDAKAETSAEAKLPEMTKTGLSGSQTPNAKPADIPEANSAALTARDEVETFNAASGKAALAQLLERSKKAADSARKRLVLMYAFLSVTAVVLVVFYYYLLHNDSTMVVSLPPPTPSIDGAAPLVGSVVPSIDSTATAETPVAPADITNENASTVAPSMATEGDAVEKVVPLAELNEWPEQTNPPPRAITKQPKRVSDDYDNTSISLPPEHIPKQAMVIEHKPAENAVSEAIARGYTAYQAGDLAGAGAAYREALEQDPYQRDALLGAAAVAVREGRQQDALTLYQKRLARDPKDEYAQAGILALSSSAEQNPQLESELTRLLLEYPDAAHLHFLKGSLYAARQQWAAAQLAFFEAWQRDNKNPDLAFNLAVALDHLSQPKEAARFYRQALSLGNARPAGFSVEAVRHRLQDLEQQHVQEGIAP